MRLLPTTPKFFDFFEELSRIARKEASLLKEIKVSKSAKSVREYAKKVRTLEEKADKICHKIFVEADSTFLTPIDREDIYLLAKSLDNIIDLIENVCGNLDLYKITKPTAEFKRFSELVYLAINQVYAMTCRLKDRRMDVGTMRKHIIKIHTLENEGDRLRSKAIKSLFSNHKGGVEIIKWKDIYENLEAILDECEDTADVVNTIIVKNF